MILHDNNLDNTIVHLWQRMWEWEEDNHEHEGTCGGAGYYEIDSPPCTDNPYLARYNKLLARRWQESMKFAVEELTKKLAAEHTADQRYFDANHATIALHGQLDQYRESYNDVVCEQHRDRTYYKMVGLTPLCIECWKKWYKQTHNGKLPCCDEGNWDRIDGVWYCSECNRPVDDKDVEIAERGYAKFVSLESDAD